MCAVYRNGVISFVALASLFDRHSFMEREVELTEYFGTIEC
jgi:hypothetical protein